MASGVFVRRLEYGDFSLGIILWDGRQIGSHQADQHAQRTPSKEIKVYVYSIDLRILWDVVLFNAEIKYRNYNMDKI